MQHATIDAFIAENHDAILRDIQTLVEIPSVEGAPLPGMPFGKAVNDALEAALAMAHSMGLAAQNVDGYFGFADLQGKSDMQIAAIAHLDVVPEGNGWTQNPFTMKVRDGYLLGRGVSDDKGPLVLTLYAAKYFKEQGKQLPYTLRLLFGTNEESGMGGLRYYQTKYEDPAFCFTPDGAYPVGYGEKGIFSGDFISSAVEGNLLSLSGGIASNVIPDRATALLKADAAALLPHAQIEITAENGAARLLAKGVGGHAAMPQGTKNAIGILVNYLLQHNLCSESETKCLRMLSALHSDTDGTATGTAADDGVFDPLTCIGGMISLENGIITQNINVRYPTNTSAEKLTQQFSAFAAPFGAHFAARGSQAPFYLDPDSPVIRILCDTYNEVSGTQAKPFTMGGGTYARHFKNAVSFGIEEETVPVPDWVGPIHGADEGISIELLMRSLKIFILAIERLMQIEF